MDELTTPDDEQASGAFDRRRFLKRAAIASAVAVPVVSSFSMSGVNAAFAQQTNVSGRSGSGSGGTDDGVAGEGTDQTTTTVDDGVEGTSVPQEPTTTTTTTVTNQPPSTTTTTTSPNQPPPSTTTTTTSPNQITM